MRSWLFRVFGAGRRYSRFKTVHSGTQQAVLSFQLSHTAHAKWNRGRQWRWSGPRMAATENHFGEILKRTDEKRNVFCNLTQLAPWLILPRSFSFHSWLMTSLMWTKEKRKSWRCGTCMLCITSKCKGLPRISLSVFFLATSSWAFIVEIGLISALIQHANVALFAATLVTARWPRLARRLWIFTGNDWSETVCGGTSLCTCATCTTSGL